jgi:hypothetical protein
MALAQLLVSVAPKRRAGSGVLALMPTTHVAADDAAIIIVAEVANAPRQFSLRQPADRQRCTPWACLPEALRLKNTTSGWFQLVNSINESVDARWRAFSELLDITHASTSGGVEVH